jgi:hypothetical protein
MASLVILARPSLFMAESQSRVHVAKAPSGGEYYPSGQVFSAHDASIESVFQEPFVLGEQSLFILNVLWIRDDTVDRADLHALLRIKMTDAFSA